MMNEDLISKLIRGGGRALYYFFSSFVFFGVKAPSAAEVLNEKGKRLYVAGDLNGALISFGDALKIDSNYAAAYSNSGAVLKDLGRSSEALNSFDLALSINPYDAYAHYNKGLALLELKRPVEALSCIDTALSNTPSFAEAHNTRGGILNELGRLDEALLSFCEALHISPDYTEAHFNRGLVLQKLKRLNEALDSYGSAIVISPAYYEAYANRGAVLLEISRPKDALNDFDVALGLRPHLLDAHSHRGQAFHKLNCLNEALAAYDAALVIDRNHIETLANRGLVLLDLNRTEEALKSFDVVLALDSGNADAYNCRGIALAHLNRLEDALVSFDAALAFEAEHAEAYSNRGTIFKELYRMEEALASYNAALAINPEYADANWNKALFLILNQDYVEGWKLYEWRWRREKTKMQRRFKEPCWFGEDILGKTLLIYPEQGLGDYIQFYRYAYLLVAKGVNIILSVPKPLFPLVSAIKSEFHVVEDGADLPPFDFQCPVMSLPLAFGTEVETVPLMIPYIYADKSQVTKWTDRLADSRRPKIGLVWSGSTVHPNDYNRSIPLDLFECILKLPLQFHSLQKDIRSNDQMALSNCRRIQVHSEELVNFSDTAALVELMDLVISVDTSVAHLAGAMGKKVWILLPFMPDFRWMLDRSDSPWYPTATLFRQTKSGDWHSVISEVEQNLKTLYLNL